KIDQIEDQQFYTLSNCLLKHFYEKKLSTTVDTIIKIVEKQETVKQPNIICCPDNLNILVNKYPIYNNKDCKKSRVPNTTVPWLQQVRAFEKLLS
ncbi:unnamed protein product, partial [Porites lobata]